MPAHVIEHQPPDAPFDDRVPAMIEAYSAGLADLLGDGAFDVIHAQDCISANAALSCATRASSRTWCGPFTTSTSSCRPA